MKKMDKETLLDLHITMKDLIDEVQDLLRLEAPSSVSDRAKIWLEQIADALGGGNYVDTYTATFWTTLEELGIIKVDGSTADLQDDEDDENDGLEDEEEAKEKECPRCLVGYPLHIKKCITKQCGRELGDDTIHKKPIKGIASYQTDSECHIGKDGVRRWYNKYGQLHRSDGPAVIKADGHKEWHQYGQPHRDDAPAIQFANGDTIWYWRGKYHREDGPAINFNNGHTAWYRFGVKIHPTPHHSGTKIDKTSDSEKKYSRGWDRIWGDNTPNPHLLTEGTDKENNNEGEDFVEVDYDVDESKKQGKGNQEQNSGMDQKATGELKEAKFELAKEPKPTPLLLPKNREDGKDVFPFPFLGWGEFGDWMGVE